MIKSLYPNFLIYVPIPKLHTLTLSRPCSCGLPLYFAVSVSTELQKKQWAHTAIGRTVLKKKVQG